MFEIGKHYELTYGYGDTEGTSVFLVTAWEHPLLKVSSVEGEQIFNVSAAHFLKARYIGDVGNTFDKF